MRAALGLGGLALVIALLAGLLRNRAQPPRPSEPPSASPAQPITQDKVKPSATLQPETSDQQTTPFTPLKADTPTDEQLRGLIQAWLDNKALVLQGDDSALNQVARPHLIERVDQQRSADVAAGRSMTVNAVVTRVEVASRQPRRIEVNTRVSYSDQTFDASGQVVGETKPSVLSVVYILGRDGDQWKLTAYIPQG